MARPTTVALTEDERKKFDDIGLDGINAMTDINQLNKLAKYMECVFVLPAPRISRFHTERFPIWKRRTERRTEKADRPSPARRETRDARRETRNAKRDT